MILLASIRAPQFLPDSLSSTLFENHWSWWIGAAAAAIILLLLARSRADRRLLKAALIILAVTVAWLLSALLFDTAGERLYAVHLDMADAAKKGDIDRILSHLSEDFTTSALAIKSSADARAAISSRLKEVGIKEVIIRAYKSTHDGAHALTAVNVLTQTGSGTLLTGWQLSWDDQPSDDWKIVRAKLTTLNNEPAPEGMILQ